MPDKEHSALVLRRCKLLFLLRRLDAGGEELDELGLPSRSSASLSEGWWEEMLVGEGAA